MDVQLEDRRFLALLRALSWYGNLTSTAVLDGYLLGAVCHVALRPRRFQMTVLVQFLRSVIGCETKNLTRS